MSRAPATIPQRTIGSVNIRSATVGSVTIRFATIDA